MTLSDKIVELIQHREAIRTAINDKGVDLAEGSHMSDYAGAINEISGGGVSLDNFGNYTLLTPDMVSGTIGSGSQWYSGTATHLIIDDSFPTDNLRNLFSEEDGLVSLVILTDKFINLNNLFYWGGRYLKNIFINTSNVTDMSSMFCDFRATTELDLSSFDTSKVTNMSQMFQYSRATTLDLSSFDTSNVTNMNFMFSESKATSLDLSSFNTSNVTNMGMMFYNSQATELNISSFNTSNVTTMSSMFEGSPATTLDLSFFNTSNVTDMALMFARSQATTLDLSSFDTSKVTNMSFMFSDSQATVGYARTQADADKFNASSGKPEGLNFVVKEA